MAINKKHILKNTLFLYVRMIIIMVVNLYVSKEILSLLGVVDYGIYNVVGGVVGMLSFLNSTLSSSSQRFFSIEIANDNQPQLKEWFSINITLFIFIAIGAVIVAETLGLWFLNNQMTIPQERLHVANIIYQLSIIAIIFQMIRIPYDGLIIAREKMSIFAGISIFEALLKLGIVAVLTYTSSDRLLSYGICMTIMTLLITTIYVVYCNVKFSESHYKPLWNTDKVKQLISFSGWHILGSTSGVIRSYGINLLLNIFFNPAINAARAIAYQVSGTIQQLSGNFFVAVKPQIYKSYAERDIRGMINLIMLSTALCVFLVSIIILPILTRTEYVLNIWLKDVPEYAVIFTQLVLINAMFEATAGPTIAAALATAMIKKYEIVVSILAFSNLPISYVLLKWGCPPESTMIVAMTMSCISVFVRCQLLTKLIDISFKRYAILITKLCLSNFFVYTLCVLISRHIQYNFIGLIYVVVLSTILLSIIYFLFVFDKNERKNIIKHLPFIKKIDK